MQGFEILRDNVDYSIRFVMDRKFNSIDNLYAWANEIALGIGFQITRVSYKHKEERSRVILYLRCHRNGNIR